MLENGELKLDFYVHAWISCVQLSDPPPGGTGVLR